MVKSKKSPKQYMAIADVWNIEIKGDGYLGSKMDIVIDGTNSKGRRVQITATCGLGASDDIVRKIKNILKNRLAEYVQLDDLVKKAAQS